MERIIEKGRLCPVLRKYDCTATVNFIFDENNQVVDIEGCGFREKYQCNLNRKKCLYANA
jgi:hypothetical protein